MCNLLHTDNVRLDDGLPKHLLYAIKPMPPRSKSGIAYKWMEEKRYEGFWGACSGEQYTHDDDGWITWNEEPDKAFSCFATEWEARRAKAPFMREAHFLGRRLSLWEIEYDDARDEHLDRGLDGEWRAFLMVKRFRPIRKINVLASFPSTVLAYSLARSHKPWTLDRRNLR